MLRAVPSAWCLALAVLATAGAGCGSDPVGFDEPPNDQPDGGDVNMPVNVPGETYYRRLLERRKVVDLYPWIELYSGGQIGCLPPASAINSQVNLSITRPYALDIGELTIAGLESFNNGGAQSVQPVPLMLLSQIGPKAVDQAIRQFADVSLIGDPANGWWPLGAGAFYARQEVLRMQANTILPMGAAGAGALGLQLHIAGRGYREYPKGSITPVQRTRAEYAELGYSFEPYAYGGRVTVPGTTPAGQEVVLQFTFDRDFLADDFTMNVFRTNVPQDTWPVVPGVNNNVPLALISFDSDYMFFSEKIVRWAVTGEPQPRTAWKFLIPITFQANQTINFRVALPLADAAGGDFDFVFHGHLLQKP